MNTQRTFKRFAFKTAITGIVAGLALGFAGCGPVVPPTQGASASMRLITEAQYRNIIADTFGTDIVVAGRFDSPKRTEGLLQIGAGSGAITPSAFERYDVLARSIAAQVVDTAHRHILVPCAPHAEDQADRSCARQFLSTVGLRLYRRPLSTSELQSRVEIANAAADEVSDFYDGLAVALTTMLVSPHFLYITDTVEPDPEVAGTVRLTEYARASRLSFFLWNSSPDSELLGAAGRGELATRRGLKQQIDRMVRSPRFKTGVRAFFSDMLGFDAFDTLSKDGAIFPAFGGAVVQDAKEQTLRTIVDLLVDEQADYRDLFNTRHTFMNGPLAVVYRVPIEQPDRWMPYEFDEESPRAGILTHLSFLALHSLPGKTSPTLRGLALRELLLCQKIPDPPGDVSFDGFNDPNSPNRTARQRLSAHSTDPTCAGCHRLTDPIGLALENFDGAGQYRTVENGALIDVTGQLDGQEFLSVESFAATVRANPAAVSCLTHRAYTYAVQRATSSDERGWMSYLTERFIEDGHRLPALFERIAASDAFYAVHPASSVSEPRAVATHQEPY